MDTKGNIKITIEGSSLTEAEKKEILEAVQRELDHRNDKIVDFRIPEEKKSTWYQKVGEKIGDAKWNASVKLGMMSMQEKLALITAIPVLTTATIKMSQEMRLVAREHRLQKEARRQAKRRKMYE